MNCFRQGRGWLVLIPAAMFFISSVAAQNATNLIPAPVSAKPDIVPPPMPAMPAMPAMPPSPLVYFRKLLAMSPQQRQAALASKPPGVRVRILAKVNEYSALDSDDRELRLRATELRWYLMPILEAPADGRPARLALVPADIRDLVRSRLMEWQILPTPLQQEFLNNEHIAGYFAGLSTTNGDSDVTAPSNAEQSRWNGYSEAQRQAMIGQFNQFFDLSPVEKQEALGELTDTERKQMDVTLQAFGKLPIRQRIQCIRAFGKFANMSPEERAEFLKNAQRWSKMTASERQAWRDLVAHVPQWPALPSPQIPPSIMPPAASQNMRVVAATNHG